MEPLSKIAFSEKSRATPQHKQKQGICEKADVSENPEFNENAGKTSQNWSQSRKSRFQKNRGRSQNTANNKVCLRRPMFVKTRSSTKTIEKRARNGAKFENHAFGKNRGRNQNTGKNQVFLRRPMFLKTRISTKTLKKRARNGAKVENHVFRKIAGEAKTQAKTRYL